MEQFEERLISCFLTNNELDTIANNTNVSIDDVKSIICVMAMYLANDFLCGKTDDLHNEVHEKMSCILKGDVISQLSKDASFKNGIVCSTCEAVLQNALSIIDGKINAESNINVDDNVVIEQQVIDPEEEKDIVDEPVIKVEEQQVENIAIDEPEEKLEKEDNKVKEDPEQKQIINKEIVEEPLTNTKQVATYNPKIIYDEEYIEDDYEENNNKKGKCIDIILVVLIVLFLIIIGIIAYKAITDPTLFDLF